MSTMTTSTTAATATHHVPAHHDRDPLAGFRARRVDEEFFDFSGWKICVRKSPILPSICYCDGGTGAKKDGGVGVVNEIGAGDGNSKPGPAPAPSSPRCQVCRFNTELQLKHLPEMVFPDNVLKLVYGQSGFTLEFNTFDALKLIDTTSSSSVAVACSDSWKSSKMESGLPTNEVLEPFDWTYSTDYKGTISYEKSDAVPQIISDPSIKLDLEKLKQRENILFYHELQLYEDELHDNGVSNLSAKIRVMPSGFLILLRFFLRVDHVLVKICDTRIHYEADNKYFIRQFQVREQNYSALQHLEPQLFTDPNALYTHLPLTSETNEKIIIGDGDS